MKAIPLYLRKKIVKAAEQCGSNSAVARRFGVSEGVVRRYRKLAEKDALEPKPPAGGSRSKLTDKDRKRLLKEVDKHPDATLSELIDACGLTVSTSTVCRELKKLDRPRKRKVPRAAEQQEPEVQARRDAWAEMTETMDYESLIFVDETSIATNMTKTYGRAPAGDPVYTDTPHRNYKTLTVLSGMRLDGSDVLPTSVYSGGTTTDRMVEYINGPLSEVLHPGDVVVADNLAAHKANRVAEALGEQNAEIWFLPPYSPDLNPIERMFSKIKGHLKKAKAKTVETLKRALDEALENVTDSDIYNWFVHSTYFEPA